MSAPRAVPAIDFTIARLGDCRVPSPMSGVRFVQDDERVLYPATTNELTRLAPWIRCGLKTDMPVYQKTP